MARKILVLCNANIGRSPLLAAAIQATVHGTDIEVKSAGVRVPADGTHASAEFQRMVQRLTEKGQRTNTKLTREHLNHIRQMLQAHHPTQVTSDMVREADLILTMDRTQRDALVQQFGSQIRGLEIKMWPVQEYLFTVAHRKSGSPMQGRHMQIPDPIEHIGDKKMPFPVGQRRNRILGQILRLGHNVGTHLRTARR